MPSAPRPRRTVATLAVALAVTALTLTTIALALTAPALALTTTAAAAPASTQPPSAPSPAPPVASNFGPDPASSGAIDSDPLADNGFDSPLCRNATVAQSLGPQALANCQTSSFESAQAPIASYGFDVHIDTGLLPSVEPVVQDALLTPIWTALVWLVHAVLLALEWAYSLDLLNAANVGKVGTALRSAEATLTQPWLVAALAVASVIVLYHGLVRRRVAQTVGEAVLMVAMMAGGLWIIADPQGTVGEASGFAEQASLGTLAAISSGDPSQPQRSFADGLGALFTATVKEPWCFMEFGEVDWCQSPARLDPRLRAAAAALAAQAAARASCRAPPVGLTLCAPTAAVRSTLARSERLVQDARTNGDLFLAFPANGPERNSINDSGSLLHVLCGASTTSSCTAPTAPLVQFRTQAGTWPRAGGLLFIAIGVSGMLLLVAFIALRLLGASLSALFYLLLAPVAVLAPAFGEGGRNAFRSWGLRLLAAIVAKLLFSVFLGVVLLMLDVLVSMGSLGWWTQWLLIASFWWLVYQHRHSALEFASLGQRDTATRGLRAASALLALRQLTSLGSGAARVVGRAGRLAVRPQPALPPPRPPRTPRPPDAGAPPPPSRREVRKAELLRSRQEQRMRAHAGHERPSSENDAAREQSLHAGRARAAQLAVASQNTAAAGDRRRELRLKDRTRRVREQLAQQTAEQKPPGVDTAAFLDTQQRIPRGARQDHRPDELRDAPLREHRDYAALAPLAAIAPPLYKKLPPAEQLRARVQIDRELAKRARASALLARDPTLAAQSHHDARERPPAPAPHRSPSPTHPAGREPAPATRARIAPRQPPESIVLRRERQFGIVHDPDDRSAARR